MAEVKINNTTINLWAVIISTIILLIAFAQMYGSLDGRVTVLETEVPHKVSTEQLYNKLNAMESKLIKKIEEIKNR